MLPAMRLRLVLLLLPLSGLVLELPAQPGGSTVRSCLQEIKADNWKSKVRCVDQIVDEGEAADIEELSRKLGLTSVQPLMSLEPPAARFTKPVSEVPFRLHFFNPSPRPALIRARPMRQLDDQDVLVQATGTVQYQTFGFTWDRGVTSEEELEFRTQSPFTWRLCGTDQSLVVSMSLRHELNKVGRYRFRLKFRFAGTLTVPEEAEPGWLEEAEFTVDYLPEDKLSRQRLVGKRDNLRINVEEREAVYRSGEDIKLVIRLSNHPNSEPLLLPEVDSFFAAPVWFVILDRRTDEILAHGNVIPLDQMQAETSSTEIQPRVLPPGASMSVVGSLEARLPEGRYTGVIGFTVFRDPGRKNLWEGEAISPDFDLNIGP
jgi:hypothetical protein